MSAVFDHVDIELKRGERYFNPKIKLLNNTNMIDKVKLACLVAHCDRASGFAVAKTVAREMSTAK